MVILHGCKLSAAELFRCCCSCLKRTATPRYDCTVAPSLEFSAVVRRLVFSGFIFPTFCSAYEVTCVTQSWTWIGSIHGLDWIRLGPMTAILCFFIYIFSILTNWQTLML